MFWNDKYKINKDFWNRYKQRYSRGKDLNIDEISVLLKAEPPVETELYFFKKAFLLSRSSGSLLENFRILNGETQLEDLILHSRGKDHFFSLLRGSIELIDINYMTPYGHTFASKWLVDLNFDETKYLYDNGYDFNKKIVFDNRDINNILNWSFRGYSLTADTYIDVINKVTFLLKSGVKLPEEEYNDFFYCTGSDEPLTIEVYLKMIPFLDNKTSFALYIRDHFELSNKKESEMLSYLL